MHEPSINRISVLLLVCSLQNLVLALALIRSGKSNRSANLILAVFLMVFSISLIDGFLSQSFYYYKYPHLIGLASLTCFLYGPLLYFYVRAFTATEDFALKWEHLVHLIPSAMKTFRIMDDVLLVDAAEKVRLLTLSLDRPGWYPDLDSDPKIFVPLIHTACYLFASLRLIVQYSSKIARKGTPLEKIKFAWLRDCFIVLFCLWGIFSSARTVSPGYNLYRESMNAVRLLASAAISVMAIRGFRQRRIFAEARPPESVGTQSFASPGTMPHCDRALAVGDSPEKEKYRKSPLTNEQSENILRALTHVMETEKLFLDPELSLPKLSKKLFLSPNHVSQVINGKLNKAFLDYVNEYRLREAKRLLKAPESAHLSILGTAIDAGFSSKNSFYSAFKKYTGMTPSQYRMQHTAPEKTREQEPSSGRS